MGSCRLLNAYWVDEVAGLVSCGSPDGSEPADESVGRALPDKQVRIVDEEGVLAPAGAHGRVQVTSVGAKSGTLSEDVLVDHRGRMDEDWRLWLDPLE